jgi:hypothetical protein
MESRRSPAEELPALYRSVLEGVSHLELAGQRREAGAIRAAASRAYTVWNDDGRRRLIGLLRRVERGLQAEPTYPATPVGVDRTNRVRAAT